MERTIPAEIVKAIIDVFNRTMYPIPDDGERHRDREMKGWYFPLFRAIGLLKSQDGFGNFEFWNSRECKCDSLIGGITLEDAERVYNARQKWLEVMRKENPDWRYPEN